MTRYSQCFLEKVCWITGGGSGIGSSLAIKLSESGAQVVISGRDEKKLQQIADNHKNISAIALDVSRLDDWQKAVRQIEETYGQLDLLVLNAGTCEYVDLPEFKADLFDRVFKVNFMGIVKGIEATLPLLRRSDCGHLAAVTSSSARLPLPRAEAYGASKAAASYLLDSLRLDLGSAIKVSNILPGFVATPMTDKNDFPMPFIISTDQAADRIIKGLAKGHKHIYFPGRFTWPLRFLGILPISIQQFFTRKFRK